MELMYLKVPQVNFYIGQDGAYRQKFKFGYEPLNQAFKLIISRNGKSSNVFPDVIQYITDNILTPKDLFTRKQSVLIMPLVSA